MEKNSENTGLSFLPHDNMQLTSFGQPKGAGK